MQVALIVLWAILIVFWVVFPPERNNRPFSKTLFPLLTRVLDSLNMDCKGLESTF